MWLVIVTLFLIAARDMNSKSTRDELWTPTLLTCIGMVLSAVVDLNLLLIVGLIIIFDIVEIYNMDNPILIK